MNRRGKPGEAFPPLAPRPANARFSTHSAPANAGTNGVAEEEADALDVTAARTGDEEAFGRLIARHQREIAGQMYRFTRDAATHEELVHDVFVEAFLSLPGYRGQAPFLWWLRKIAVRVGYRYWEQRRRSRAEITLADEEWERLRGTLPAPTAESELAELAHRALAQLAPTDRLVLTLQYLESYSMTEIAAATGWTVPGTKVRAFRARARLKKLLDRERT